MGTPVFLRRIKQMWADNSGEIRGTVLSLLGCLSFASLSMVTYTAGITIHPITYAMWKWGVKLVLSAIILAITRPAIPTTTKEIALVTTAGSINSVGSVCLSTAVILTSPGEAMTLYFTLPIVVIIIDSVITCRPPRPVHLAFASVTTAGVAFITRPSFLLGLSAEWDQPAPGDIAGVALALSAAVLCGCYLTAVKTLTETYSNPTFILIFSSSVQCVTLTLIYHGVSGLQLMPDDPFSFLYFVTGGCLAILAYSFIILATVTERPVFVAVMWGAEVVFTLLFQNIFLGMPLRWFSFVGAGLICISCVGVAITRSHRERDATPSESGSEGESFIFQDE